MIPKQQQPTLLLLLRKRVSRGTAEQGRRQVTCRDGRVVYRNPSSQAPRTAAWHLYHRPLILATPNHHHQALPRPTTLRLYYDHRSKDVRNNNNKRPHPHHRKLPSRLRPAPLAALRFRLIPSPSSQPTHRLFLAFSWQSWIFSQPVQLFSQPVQPRRLGDPMEQSPSPPPRPKPTRRAAEHIHERD